MKLFLATALAFVVLVQAALVTEAADIVHWPAPAEEMLSEYYTVTVNGQPVSAYACRVSAVPLNQVWPGYQRPVEQTELAGFAYWDMDEPVKIVVQSAPREIGGRASDIAGNRA